MGLKFSKSVKAGSFRINFSTSGVGKGFYYTKKTNGGGLFATCKKYYH